MYSLQNCSRELDNDRRKVVVEHDQLLKLLIMAEKKAEDAENKITWEDKLRWEEEWHNTKLVGKVEGLEIELAKIAEELADEVPAAKANGAIWMRDYTIQQLSASSPMLKWLEKYLPTEEEEEPTAGTPTD